MALIPLLFLAFGQTDEARLAVRVSLERPRMSFSEFGAWVQNRTHLPVIVSIPMRDRKATVLVADRPVGEIMARVAEAFFLEWERTKDGYTLRMQPKVASEEAAVREAEAQAQNAWLKASVDLLVELGSLTEEQLASRIQVADQSATDAMRLPASARSKETLHLNLLVSRLAYDHSLLAAGEALAGLNATQRAAVLNGTRFFASDRGGNGIGKISKRQVAPLSQMFSGGSPSEDPNAPPKKTEPPDGIFVSVKGDPAVGKLRVEATIRDKDGADLGSSSTWIDGDQTFGQGEDSSLARRIDAWATQDPVLLATKIKPDAVPLPAHSSSRHTLADHLVALHRRTGLPIVADGFRLAIEGSGPKGSDLKAWIASSKTGPIRASNGWLMLRKSSYWRQLAREIAERIVTPIERLNPALDDFANFACALTPVQAEALDNDALVMDAPNAAVESNVPLLRLWHALTPQQRKRAIDDELPLPKLSGSALRLALACLDDWDPATNPGDAVHPYLLPGGPLLPKGLVLSLEEREEMSSYEQLPPSFDPKAPMPSPILRNYVGFVATIQTEQQAFRLYELPLRPKP